MGKVFRTLDTITIERLDKPEVVTNFIVAVHKGVQAGFTKFNIEFRLLEYSAIFPNAACPLAGYVSHYRKHGLEFSRIDSSPAVASTQIMSPLSVKNSENRLTQNVLNKVWEFNDSEDVYRLTDAFIDELFGLDNFEQGALHSLEWSLSEIMDNVIQHSKSDSGFVMGQIHPKTKHIAFSIFDGGQGIFNSLQTYQKPPKTALDALTLCVRENVTRDKSIGQGNGMFGLYQIVNQNKGLLSITSHGALFTMREGKLETLTELPFLSKENGCVSIDFQLDYNKPISLADALNVGGKNYMPVNYRLENFENDAGEIVFNVKDKSSGFGTRQAGAKVRKEVINIYTETKKVIIIDFDGITLISSSFADEFIGKLVLEFGFFGFNNIIRLRNMNELTQSIVQRSVSQRMAESLRD